MKIGFLCNGRLAIPALEVLLRNNISPSVVIPDNTSEDVDHIRHICKSSGCTINVIYRDKADAQLNRWYDREKPDLVLVLTFPYKIPSRLINGQTPWFNFHFALLPQYRGAEPVFWQIRNREPFGAVSVHKMTDKIDAGPVVITDKVPISPEDTHGMHLSKLAMTAPSTVIKLLNLWGQYRDVLPMKEQDASLGKIYPRAQLKDLIIDWEAMEAGEIIALIRASNPWNKGAITFLDGIPLKITAASAVERPGGGNAPVGSFYFYNNELMVKSIGDFDVKIEIISAQEGIYTGTDFARLFPVENKTLKKGY